MRLHSSCSLPSFSDGCLCRLKDGELLICAAIQTGRHSGDAVSRRSTKDGLLPTVVSWVVTEVCSGSKHSVNLLRDHDFGRALCPSDLWQFDGGVSCLDATPRFQTEPTTGDSLLPVLLGYRSAE
jgi:hypothetical protein